MLKLKTIPKVNEEPEVIIVGAVKNKNDFFCDEEDLLHGGPYLVDIVEELQEILKIDLSDYYVTEILPKERKFISGKILKQEFGNCSDCIFVEVGCDYDSDIEEIYQLDKIPDDLEVVLYFIFSKK